MQHDKNAGFWSSPLSSFALTASELTRSTGLYPSLFWISLRAPFRSKSLTFRVFPLLQDKITLKCNGVLESTSFRLGSAPHAKR